MTEKYKIAGYCRISNDDDLSKDNVSIENQKAIISKYVKERFPKSELEFFVDRDQSGYSFDNREQYPVLRQKLIRKEYDMLIVKDYSRFVRNTALGLLERQALMEMDVRIISIEDNEDTLLKQADELIMPIKFLINSFPVVETSKKVKSVIQNRQSEGKWRCAVPYGYILTDEQEFRIEESEAQVIRLIFELYTGGWGYQKIAHYLTEQHIPTPRMGQKLRKEAEGKTSKYIAKEKWSNVSVQGILSNDFYIGTLRQGKSSRRTINGKQQKNDVSKQLVFEHNHEPIIDDKTFLIAQQEMGKRTKDNYRGKKKYNNEYSGLIKCGDCGSPMFAMNQGKSNYGYRCGNYNQNGLKGCTSHFVRVSVLEEAIRAHLLMVRRTSAEMINKLQKDIKNEKKAVKQTETALNKLEKQLSKEKENKKGYFKERTRQKMRNPNDDSIDEIFDELIAECDRNIESIQSQIDLVNDRHNTVVKVNRLAGIAIDLFDELLKKEHFDKQDLDILIDKIYVYEYHIEIKLKADIEAIFKSGTLSVVNNEEVANFNEGIVDISSTEIVEAVTKRPDKVYDVNVISNGDPLEIYTDANGEVIFKKYSPIGELGPYTKQYVDVLGRTTGAPVVICDRDHVIAVSGLPKKDMVGKRISPLLESYMERRNTYVLGQDKDNLIVSEDSPKPVSVMTPIIGGGDVMGAVVLLSGDKANPPSQTDIKLTQVAAGFLGKQMEE